MLDLCKCASVNKRLCEQWVKQETQGNPSKILKIWKSQGFRQKDALRILWVSGKLKDTEYGTNKSVIQRGNLGRTLTMTWSICRLNWPWRGRMTPTWTSICASICEGRTPLRRVLEKGRLNPTPTLGRAVVGS